MSNKKASYLPSRSKKLTPEQVVQMLEKHGQVVSLSEAEEILKFMHKIASIAIDTYINKDLPDTEEQQ